MKFVIFIFFDQDGYVRVDGWSVSSNYSIVWALIVFTREKQVKITHESFIKYLKLAKLQCLNKDRTRVYKACLLLPCERIKNSSCASFAWFCRVNIVSGMLKVFLYQKLADIKYIYYRNSNNRKGWSEILRTNNIFSTHWRLIRHVR